MHWPPPVRAIAPVWREFLALRDDGPGPDRRGEQYSIAQIDTLIKATGEAPAVNQIPWSPAQFDEVVLEESRERGVTLEGYSPLKGTDLGHPVLTGIAEHPWGDPRPDCAALAP